MRSLGLSVLLSLSGRLVVEAGGLVDDPIGAAKITYLDSSASVKWSASVSGGVPAGCTFTNETDWLPSTWIAEVQHVVSQEACCALCWTETLCAASVYVASDSTCWLKNNLTGGSISQAGRVSCVKARGAEPKLTIPAQVPGDLLTDLQRAGQIGDPNFEKNFLNDTLYQQVA